MRLVASSCVAAACPAVYEEDDAYIVVGAALDDGDLRTDESEGAVAVEDELLQATR